MERIKSLFAFHVLERKIAFSAFIQYAGKVAQILMAMVTVKLLSNFFAAQEYGVYLSVMEYGLFFSTVANLGIFANAVRELSDDAKHPEVFVSALITRGVSALVIFAVAIAAALFLHPSTVFVSALMFFMGSLFFDYITSVCDAYFQATYHMGRAVLALVIGRLCNLLVVLLLVRVFPVSSMQMIPVFLLAPLFGSFVAVGLSLWFVRLQLKFRFVFDPVLCRKIFFGSLAFGIINILNSLYFRFLPDFLVHRVALDAHFAGFVISSRIAETLSMVSTFLMFSVLPGFRHAVTQRDFVVAKKLFRIVLWVLSGIGILVLLAGSFVGPYLIAFLTHQKYVFEEMQLLMPLLLLLAVISYFYDVVLLTLFAFGKDITFLKGELLAFCLASLVFGISFLITDPLLQLLCIISGAIVGETFITLWGFYHVRRSFLQLR